MSYELASMTGANSKHSNLLVIAYLIVSIYAAGSLILKLIKACTRATIKLIKV